MTKLGNSPSNIQVAVEEQENGTEEFPFKMRKFCLQVHALEPAH